MRGVIYKPDPPKAPVGYAFDWLADRRWTAMDAWAFGLIATLSISQRHPGRKRTRRLWRRRGRR